MQMHYRYIALRQQLRRTDWLRLRFDERQVPSYLGPLTFDVGGGGACMGFPLISATVGLLGMSSRANQRQNHDRMQLLRLQPNN
jgi:hypothetical protein